MSGSRILAIDDEENFLTLLSRILGKEGYEVRTALTGEEALKLLGQEPFEVALIDIRMAPMDGLSLLDHIKRRHPCIKAIVVTAYPSSESRMLSLQKGASAYLIKPVEINDLKETIRATLSR
ncbi:MAG: response regulator [Deltaproteobacteria bacterium]|nr:response regulator [Deltaproteobacteria bacterium]